MVDKTKQEDIKHIVLVGIKSDGSIPDYQDIGWFQGIKDGYLVLLTHGGTITRYKTERVKKLQFLQEVENDD